MIENNRNNGQIYGRNDMIMLDQNNKIYGSLGLADKYVMKTEEGIRLMLSNPKLGRFADVLTEFDIYGWSKQETTTGKNLINADEYYSQFKQSDETYKSKSTILNDIRISLSEFVGKEITLSVKLTVGANTSAVYLMYVDSEQKKINGSIIKSGLTGKSILTVTPVSNTDYFVITYGVGNDDVTFSELQLELGSVATSYEPYTGGQPSPNPDYPQEIESAGVESAGIAVTVHGKNLLNFEEFLKARGVIYTKESESYQITNIMNAYRKPYKFSGEDIEITISGIVDDITSERASIDVLDSSKKVVVSISTREGFAKCKASYIRLNYKERGIFNIQKVQIERGVTATAYEPYHEPQSLSIQTPTGLLAIPVDSDGNYTDANGQQWIADYVDLKLGKLYKKVMRLNLKDVDATSIAHGFHSNGNGYLSFSVKNVSKEYQPISNRYKGSMWTQESGYVYIPNSNTIVFVDDRFTDKQTAIKLVQNTYVIYALTSQIETDLTPEEIEQYKKLSAKTPTTIIENNYNTWMKATYKSTESV